MVSSKVVTVVVGYLCIISRQRTAGAIPDISYNGVCDGTAIELASIKPAKQVSELHIPSCFPY